MDNKLREVQSMTLEMNGATQVTVNGEPRHMPANTTVAGVVESMGLSGKRIAVERNGEIVPRSRHEQEKIEAGDRIEIVVAVGGG